MTNEEQIRLCGLLTLAYYPVKQRRLLMSGEWGRSWASVWSGKRGKPPNPNHGRGTTLCDGFGWLVFTVKRTFAERQRIVLRRVMQMKGCRP